MRFRPCIDIHNGKVKQIIGSSLKDKNNVASVNFESKYDGAYYAELYKKDGLKGGHIIMLNAPDSEYYDKTWEQAIMALEVYKGGFHIGGGITEKNALNFLERGASHVIVTSYVFSDGKINYDNLNRISKTTGKDHLVLDLSCRKRDGNYYIVTDRWQKFTDTKLSNELFDELSMYCSEFLIHAVDVEGKSGGIEEELIKMLAEWNGIPITYAGGVASFEDLERIHKLGTGKLDVTIGSSLDLFGGNMSYKKILEFMNLVG